MGFKRHIYQKSIKKEGSFVYSKTTFKHSIGSSYSLKSCSSAELFSASLDNAILKTKKLLN
jgi:hypothetical protein